MRALTIAIFAGAVCIPASGADGSLLRSNADRFLYNAPNQVRYMREIEVEIYSGSGKFGMRVFDSGSGAWHKLLMVSDGESIYSSGMTGKSDVPIASGDWAKPPTAWGEAYESRMPRGQSSWLTPQLLTLACLLCKDSGSLHADGVLHEKLRPEALLAIFGGQGVDLRGDVKSLSRRHFVVTFWVIKKGLLLKPPLTESEGCNVSSVLDVHGAEQTDLPSKVAFTQFTWRAAADGSTERFAAAEVVFDFSARRELEPKWLSQVAYEEGAGAAVREFRFPAKWAYQLSAADSPPLKGQASYPMISKKMTAVSDLEKTSFTRRMIIMSTMAVSLTIVIAAVRSKRKNLPEIPRA